MQAAPSQANREKDAELLELKASLSGTLATMAPGVPYAVTAVALSFETTAEDEDGRSHTTPSYVFAATCRRSPGWAPEAGAMGR